MAVADDMPIIPASTAGWDGSAGDPAAIALIPAIPGAVAQHSPARDPWWRRLGWWLLRVLLGALGRPGGIP